MNNDKIIEISVKTIFTDGRTAQQAFIDLIRRRIADLSQARLELMPNQVYNGVMVFPGVHAPERVTSYE